MQLWKMLFAFGERVSFCSGQADCRVWRWLQHHLRDFSHHPSLVGLACSILSQFTGKGYGTDTAGRFVAFDLPAVAFDPTALL